ncbi:nuclease SbcCD subunit D [Desulfuromonas versatilis]|uniref:Nuclease SbcCD subunit D n=1 Tax=Desulfuromonas versatilis TaxID=2802975 RepID=A0ABN6DX94_9BACT|nr:DNA repair exonuclease [Desulfuromonas versatilis]BCR04738.1 nuclease SbcCD subunit D [Desulfuromonas versatilis]
MIRILHTADLHLDAPFPVLGDRQAQRREAFLKTFERLVTLAIKSEVHLFLVAGDLFDSPRPSAATVAKVQAGLKRLADRGIVPVLLPGTHDNLVGADSVYRRSEFPGAILLDRPAIEEPLALQVNGERVFLYGFAYRTFASQNALEGMARRSDEGIHIGLLHGSRQGSPEWEYRKKDLPFTVAELRHWGLDYVALGHYHGFDLIEDGGRTLACYPGSPEGKRFGENGPRCCALVRVEKGQVEVEKATVNSLVLEDRKLDLAGCETLEQAAEVICAMGRPDLLLRLRLTGIVEAPLDLAALQARCGGAFFHLEFDDRTRLFDSDFARRIAQEETVRGVFVRQLQQRMQLAGPEERAVLEEAFREVLVRFGAFGGGAA